MEVKKIGVLGAGAMGSGIALVAAQSGYDVVLSDIDLAFVDKGLKWIGNFLNKSVEKGKMTAEQKDAIIGKIVRTTGVDEFNDVDVVIEAIIEDLQVKKDAFNQLDQVCKPEALLTTNTSSISITQIAASTKRPDRVAGLHFFNPAPVMRLVEIIRGYYTSDDTVNTLLDVTVKFNKKSIVVKKDSPGFVVNRVMMAQYIEAIKLVEEGVATPEDVDIAVKLGLNHPMGPFELHDFTGTDIGYHVANYFCDECKDIRWNPPLALKELIRAGRLGRKTGSGWYNY
ncbi:3-hydroxyacyl-CoA dehydrogenase family protein [Pelotomaculum isophthalicicum JI]|uniref:3-hydroxybutyryl-CoA dehydrogenase n=1 Tax=Pelotomaculum isophthalicicum JI TaxID=947010 RepID=A0A9X4JUQ2_9FIRM|nr:3-hydroxyacyl-CoA dehydrogenase family protein [Pelotomaculum isophthalicicum]MDF9409655.1 3-hydroxyacyl-CoA dehydrogenase family protein [Pelotomaculum isophthalicicum JI]